MLPTTANSGWVSQSSNINYLNEEQVNSITKEFQKYYDETKSEKLRKNTADIGLYS